MFWAALHRFTRSPAVPTTSEPSNLDSSSSSSSRGNSDTDMASGSEDLEGDDHVDLPMCVTPPIAVPKDASPKQLATWVPPSQQLE